MYIHALHRFLVRFHIDHELEDEFELEHVLPRALGLDPDHDLEAGITVFVAVDVDHALGRQLAVCRHRIGVDGVGRGLDQYLIRIRTLIPIPIRDRRVVIHHILIIQHRDRGKQENGTLIAKHRCHREVQQMAH